jgi:tRNA pseudouridine65 synthase
MCVFLDFALVAKTKQNAQNQEPKEKMSASPTLLYRDDHLAAFNKPAGMLVHRGWDNDKVVLMTEARDILGQRVDPVHRLDRPTSGVVLFALHKEATRALNELFAQRKVRKRYVALVRGITPERGLIDHPVPRRPREERVEAVTEYRRLATFERYSLVEAVPRTGRLHQIRRHMKHISHPLIGDVNYGKGEHNRLFRERFDLHRLALHAFDLELTHPQTGKKLYVHAPLPDDLGSPFAAMGFSETLFESAACVPADDG